MSTSPVRQPLNVTVIGAGVVGAQPYEALEKLVKDAGAAAKS